MMQRRDFLKTASISVAAAPALGQVPSFLQEAAAPAAGSLPILRSVKWGMVRGKTVLEKFQIMKELGYDGLEAISPLGGITIKELLEARDATGVFIPGVVDMVHWRKSHRLSSPDPKARAQGVAALKQAVQDAFDMGGSSVLLVPGVVGNKETENHDQCWERSTAEVKKVLPLCARLGIHILMENVWNGFCYDPKQLAQYIDGFNSPWVGSYFDIGNHIKYSPSEHWVRTLGKRIVKCDVKDWGKKGGWSKIGDGDCNWPEVRKALKEIGFTGWTTAEVGGGDKERMADVMERMRRVL